MRILPLTYGQWHSMLSMEQVGKVKKQRAAFVSICWMFVCFLGYEGIEIVR